MLNIAQYNRGGHNFSKGKENAADAPRNGGASA